MNAFYAGALLTLVLSVTMIKIVLSVTMLRNDSSSISVFPSECSSNQIAADVFSSGSRSEVKYCS